MLYIFNFSKIFSELFFINQLLSRTIFEKYCFKDLAENVILFTYLNLGSKTPTQIITTHAFWKIREEMQNWIPRESDKTFCHKNLDIPRIGMIHWISSNSRKWKRKKVTPIPYPGFSPINRPLHIPNMSHIRDILYVKWYFCQFD